ncbi:hypothetical protein [Mucilaginibacter agri]|uniref:Uncharacterized protein n=1 Tax=Mucilaginibacter agri TaxID=2695265 RepID=A0A965ZDZ7_9SPHI|nr:hypothetical protein [Mucilaginibacter agri]NCD68264.1 hypothetical protein [Mucilaginibacter agri]
MGKQYSINNFVTLSKNGKAASTSSDEQQANLYQWLKEAGFGQSEINGKTVFFKTVDNHVMPSSVIAMRYEFLNFLESHDFVEWPEGVTRGDLIEWFYDTRPPKCNRLFSNYLYRKLSNMEEEQYMRYSGRHPTLDFHLKASNLDA